MRGLTDFHRLCLRVEYKADEQDTWHAGMVTEWSDWGILIKLDNIHPVGHFSSVVVSGSEILRGNTVRIEPKQADRDFAIVRVSDQPTVLPFTDGFAVVDAGKGEFVRLMRYGADKEDIEIKNITSDAGIVIPATMLKHVIDILEKLNER